MIDFTSGSLPVLYHGTPYPEGIALHGLQPRREKTAAYDSYAEHSDPLVTAQAAEHAGAFVFATHSLPLANLYAFKTRNEGLENLPRQMFRCGFEDELCNQPIAVIGQAEAYREALKSLNPTRFNTQATENFRPVCEPDDTLTGEWISSQAVPAHALTIEPVDFSVLAGQAQFFELSAKALRQVQAGALRLKDFSTTELFEQDLILPANHKLGLPPNQLRGGRAPSAAASCNYP